MNSDQFPLVTVGTLCYNTGSYVIEALECVKKQNYPNIQHIIIDDCSKDNSAQLIEDWIRANNYRCTFIRHEVNKGVHFGLSEIFSQASGKYLVMISDDLWVGNMLRNQVKVIENLDDSYAMVYGDTQIVNGDGKIIVESIFKEARGVDFEPPSGDIFKEVLKDFYFYIQASIIKLEHFRSLNYTFTSEVISEDWDWQLALSRSFKIFGQKRVLASYRHLENSITRTNWTEKKIKLVLLSQAEMILKYYAHKRNNENDNDLIIQRVVRIYKQLSVVENFGFQDHLKFALYFLKSTKSVSVVFHFLKMLIKRVSFRIDQKEKIKKSIV